tara:strand:- start:2484 stop:2756 length:273 start_codon:yes stop_codon:yes gene_type:complete
MDMTTDKADLQGVSRVDASVTLDVPQGELNYSSWTETFGSTSGPFGGIGGKAMSVFTIEAWSDGVAAVIFCKGRVIGVFEKGFKLGSLPE